LRRGRKRWWIVGILLLLVLLSPALTLLGPEDVREKMLQQLTLKAMSERVTKGSVSDQEKALRLFRYVHEHLFTPPRGKPAGDSILEVLVRNVAWCSRQSDILAMLARCVWIDGGYVTLYGYDEVSHHTVCGLALNGSLRMFDPQNGYVFYTRRGEIATLEEVRERGPGLRSAQFRAVERFQRSLSDRYFRLFEPKHDWEIHIPSAPLWIKYMDYVYDLLGDPFLEWYQEVYFRRGETDLFTRARLQHLAGRLEEALADYDRIIAGEDTAEPPVLQVDYRPVTREVLVAETRFFRGQALFDMKEHRACLEGLGAYLRKHPDNRWRDLALYYLGESCRKLGMYESAVTYFAAIRGEALPGTPAPERLVRILDAAWARPGKAENETGEE
jgi:transglutaminase-like putative cysteine protease